MGTIEWTEFLKEKQGINLKNNFSDIEIRRTIYTIQAQTLKQLHEEYIVEFALL